MRRIHVISVAFWMIGAIFMTSCGDSVEVEPYNKSGSGAIQQPQQAASEDLGARQNDTEGIITNLDAPENRTGDYVPPPAGVLDAEAFHNFMHQTMPFQLVDLRDATAFNGDRIEMNGPTLNIQVDRDFMKKLEPTERTKVLMYYDQDGRLSSKIADESLKAGFPNYYFLAGGINAWKKLEYGHLEGGNTKTPEFSIDKLDELGVSNFKTMDLDEWHSTMHQISQKQLLDVRSVAEYAKGYVLESVNYDVDGAGFKNQINTLVKHQPVMIYGSNAAEAARAAAILKDAGFQVVYDLASGFEEFKDKGFGHIGPEAPAAPK